ncbi:putative phage protein gp47/JayE [Paenibacillus sp. DS2015]|uniref:hypothetical protein n=1 Tax=Paenibacillus sp. DS2015 TaxID=3373917 RepID=UPI003D1AE396
MSVQITINGDNAAEAIQEFATLSAAFTGQASAPVTASLEDLKPTRQTRKASDPKKEEVKEPETVKEDTQAEQDQEPAGDTVDIPTIVDLRAKAQEKGKTPEAKKAIKALLDKFESKSVSDVPEDIRTEFIAELEAL